MKQHAEITYNQIDENEEYNNIINKVINECFLNEGLDKLNLYISITLTNPEIIHELNKKYRNVDRATDVLSFPMFEKNEIEEMLEEKNNNIKTINCNPDNREKESCIKDSQKLELNDNDNFKECDVLGDLVISIPKVYEQAEEYGHSFERELAYMCVHGFYHLMGYDHIIDSDKVIMRKKEDEILNKLGITREG
jgi:probable rRNA maturation factor